MKRFALIGAAGYIAPRHLKAIKETNNTLIAALDKSDSVGILDSYFPEADFFTEFERFDRHLDKLRRKGNPVDFISITSPNYLHDSHIRFALRNHAHAICEKPLVLNPWNVDALAEIENESDANIYTILQLRLHPSIIAIKQEIDSNGSKTHYDVDLTYITSRGHWYDISWKGDLEKSGGIATNIGIHFFDMLIWIFGTVKENIVHISDFNKASGLLELEKATVRWFLSTDSRMLPAEVAEKGQKTFRSIQINGNEIEFSDGFTDLHTISYQQILAGNGFRISEAKPSIEIVYNIRKSQPIGLSGNFHPICNRLSF
ncbi:MAG: Gfo/Idh/MocA family oxidoreductase [Calditrichaeota bacterium]|nr:Gfo/Idh/MocA family oxidoreductase [Calditrichota bacterium]